MRSESVANQALAASAVQGIASKLAQDAERARFAAVLAPSPRITATMRKHSRQTLISRLFGRV